MLLSIRICYPCITVLKFINNVTNVDKEEEVSDLWPLTAFTFKLILLAWLYFLRLKIIKVIRISLGTLPKSVIMANGRLNPKIDALSFYCIAV